MSDEVKNEEAVEETTKAPEEALQSDDDEVEVDEGKEEGE